MAIKVTLEFGSIEAAVAYLKDGVQTATETMAAPTCVAAKPKRPRRTRAEMEAAKSSEVVTFPVAPATGETVSVGATAADLGLTPVTLTIDNVRAALHKVSETKGLEACKELLTKFNVDRVSSVPVEQFQAFIDDCDKATAL